MKNNVITRIIQQTKRTVGKPNKVIKKIKMQSNINMVVEFCRNLLRENPQLTSEQLRLAVINSLANANREYCLKSNTRGILFQLEAIEYLLNNSQTIEKIYNRLKDEKNLENPDNFIYNSSLKKSCDNVVKLAIRELYDMEQGLDDLTKEFLKKYKNANTAERKRLEKIYYSNGVDKFKQFIPLYIGTYPERICEYIKQLKPMVEKDIREQQYEVMEYVYDSLHKFGLMDRYLRRHNNQIKKATLIDLTYEFSSDDIDNIGLRQLFSSNFLQNQSLEDILTYSLFWQNRYSKACDEINEGIYAIDTLDLWQDIVNKREDFTLDDKVLQALLTKEKCLKELVIHIITGLKGSANSKDVSRTELNDGYVKIFTQPTVERYNKQEGENYKKIFDEVFPESRNDFKQDVGIYTMLTSQIMNAYKIKDSMMCYKIRSLQQSKKTRNWGIILEDVKNKNEENLNNDDNILIGIDYEGINMPLRLHIPKKLLIELLKSYEGKVTIPVYEGAEDFIINGELLTTGILMPILKRHGKLINNSIQDEDSQSHNLLEHIQFLKNQNKFPKHLQRKTITKKGIIYERNPRKYVNLENGKEYYKAGNEFIEVGDGKNNGNTR